MRHTGRKGEEDRRAGESVLLVIIRLNGRTKVCMRGATKYVGSPFVVIMDPKIAINCDI